MTKIQMGPPMKQTPNSMAQRLRETVAISSSNTAAQNQATRNRVANKTTTLDPSVVAAAAMQEQVSLKRRLSANPANNGQAMYK